MVAIESLSLQARRRAIAWRNVLAFGLPFTLFLLTLAPTVYNLDSAELTTAAATGGITRATGYPLYLMLGWLWSWLPLGDVGYRLNLFSAFNGALTIALAERILQRWQVGAWASFGALGLLACAPYFWWLSSIAEVYTLHTALMAGLLLALLRWAEAPSPQRLALAGLIAGLGLSHHAATVLLAPGCLWLVSVVAPRRAFAPRSLLAALGALALGLCAYLYLPLRYGALPAFNYAGTYASDGSFRPVDLQTPAGLWWLISGRAFAGQMLAYRGTELWAELRDFATHFWRAFLAVGIGPGLIGMAVLLRRNWRVGGMTVLVFVCSAGFYIDYRVVDKETMFLPTYLIWALWMGVGYQWLLNWLAAGWPPTRVRRAERVLYGVMLAAVLYAALWNYGQVDASHDWSARQRGEAVLRELPPGALVLGWWDTVPVVEYLQLVERQRPDVQAINRFLIAPDALRQLVLREAARRPVYIDSPPPDLPMQLLALPRGELYQLTLRAAPGRCATMPGRYFGFDVPEVC